MCKRFDKYHVCVRVVSLKQHENLSFKMQQHQLLRKDEKERFGKGLVEKDVRTVVEKEVNNIIKLYFSFMLSLVGPSDFFGRAAYGVMPLQNELRL